MDSIQSYPDAKHANIIHKCIQHIGTNYAEHLTLEDTARAVSLSPDYLSRIFKEETGTTFNRYLNNVRITKAKELIRRGEYRLTDISQMVGYDDQSYFTKVFRRITGLSPGEYGKKRGGSRLPRKPESPCYNYLTVCRNHSSFFTELLICFAEITYPFPPESRARTGTAATACRPAGIPGYPCR